MMPTLARFLFVGALLMVAGPPGTLARTDKGFMWTKKSNGGLVLLAYGPLDPTKNPLLMLSCLNGMSIAVLDVRTEISDAKPGDRLTIELAAGTTRSPVEGEAMRDEVSGATFAEASDVAVEPILGVLRASGPLTVKIGAESVALSDHGRAAAVADFSKDCEMD
jgi:hypothetical protein